MKLSSLAWDKKQKLWVTVHGMADTYDIFQESGVQDYTVTTFGRVDFRVVSSTKLIAFEDCKAFVDADGNTIGIGHFNTYEHLQCAPYTGRAVFKDDGLTVALAVGDHVKLMRHPGYFARVLEINEVCKLTIDSTGIRVKVAFYHISSYYNKTSTSTFRIISTSTATFSRGDLYKVNTPAPRMEISSDARKARKLVLAKNMALGNSVHHTRDRYYYAKQPRRVRKTDGAVIAEFIRLSKCDIYECKEFLNYNSSEVINILGKLDYIGKTILSNAQDRCSIVGDFIIECENCNSIEAKDNERYSDYEDTHFCQSCEGDWIWSNAVSSYFRSEDRDNVYDSARAYFNGDADDYVPSGYDYSDGGYIRHGGAWVYEDELEEIEDREGSSGLSNYHSIDRTWIEEWSNKAFLPLGVELEVYSESRNSAVKAVKKAFPTQMYLERDGSLDDDCGFEVISQPLGKTEWDTIGVKLLNTLKSHDSVAWSDPAGNNYGIHVNISRSYLSSLQEARMFMFLAAAENIGFVTAIAQRRSIYSADVDMGSLDKYEQKVRSMGGLTDITRTRNGDCKKAVVGRGKYAPINFHHNRVEIRIFQSTLNKVSFYKNLEFTWSLIEWTNTKTATGSSWLYTDFLKWLVARPLVEVDYKNLMAYLRKERYEIMVSNDDDDDDGSKYIYSTWKDIIPELVRKSIPKEIFNNTNDETSYDEVVIAVAPVYVKTNLSVGDVLSNLDARTQEEYAIAA